MDLPVPRGISRAVRKMTAQLAVRTTLREASSDGSPQFRTKIRRRRGLSLLDAQPASVRAYQLDLQRFELFRISTTSCRSKAITGASISTPNSPYIAGILCSIQR